MKILITGGCGFLGSNLAEYSVDKGCEMSIINNYYRVGLIGFVKRLLILKIKLKGLIKFLIESNKPKRDNYFETENR